MTEILLAFIALALAVVAVRLGQIRNVLMSHWLTQREEQKRIGDALTMLNINYTSECDAKLMQEAAEQK